MWLLERGHVYRYNFFVKSVLSVWYTLENLYVQLPSIYYESIVFFVRHVCLYVEAESRHTDDILCALPLPKQKATIAKKR